MVTAGTACERAEISDRNADSEQGNALVAPCADELHGTDYTLARVYCIDGIAEGLVYIDGIAVDDGGRLAMLQRQVGSVRLYDADGRHIRTVGRRGKGPGEFANPTRLGWHGSDLWVYDSDLRRFSIFSADGDLLQTQPVPIMGHGQQDLASLTFRIQPEVLRKDWITISSIFGSHLGHRHPFLGEPGTSILASVSLGGLIHRALLRVPPPDRQTAQDVSGSVMATPPFPHDVLWGLDADGSRIVIVDGRPDGRAPGALAIMALSFDGDTIYDTTIPLENVPIPSAVRRAYKERWEQRARRTTNPLQAEVIRRAAYIPEFYPEASELVVGMDGSAWIRGELEERGYVAIAFDGSVLGRLRMPPNRRILAATTSDVWLAVRDQWGVEALAHYRVIGFQESL